MNTLYLFWLALGIIGALAFFFGCRDMVRRRREAELALPIAVLFGVLVLQHLVFVYLASRLILGVTGPSGVLLLTITQALVTPAACFVAAVLIGLIQLHHHKEE